MTSQKQKTAITFRPYKQAAGGWGSVRAVFSALSKEGKLASGASVLLKQNKPKGFACVSCSWAKPADPHAFEFCENGARATAWEITQKRIPDSFFDHHTVAELSAWSDFELENEGRLTGPLQYDEASDRYLPVSWQEAFDGIAEQLNMMAPEKVVFYASGRASLETSYLYQLMARMYGSTNLPDSSNMCHESTSVALQKTIGIGVGTVQLADFEETGCMLFFGHNTGTNAPRMLHPLQEARKRGVPVITFNPLRERGLDRFVNPQSPAEMILPGSTQMSSQFVQLKIGGDTAAVAGMVKFLLEWDAQAVREKTERVLDIEFISQHTANFDSFAASIHALGWQEIEKVAGVPLSELEQAARTYASARSCMILYGMGITQHREGVRNVHMLTNLLLLKGNIGKPGAGICPIRGHSNVQGQRTVGITEKPELALNDVLRKQYNFEPPTRKGLNTVEACEHILQNQVQAFLMLGGNFVRAIPDHEQMEAAWSDIPLTVQILTKLNRSAIVHGKRSYILPCRGRIETDLQDGVAQAVTMEDSTGCMHGSMGVVPPASNNLLSETGIVAEIARRVTPANPAADWSGWSKDYSRIRDAIARTYPDIFHDFNARMWTPGGFMRPLPPRNRVWKTQNSKANFVPVDTLEADPDMPQTGDKRVLRLMTTRGDSQFNTTVYGMDDRFRGVYGGRKVLLMNAEDLAFHGLKKGDVVTASTVSSDEIIRKVDGLVVCDYDIPAGCVMGYYPELNPLVPLWHHAKESKVPASKSIPIRLTRTS